MKYKYIVRSKTFIIFVLFFLIRIFQLTKLPIFNDEAIYLDWGWRETHEPGYLFYSLYDAKQPFLMWLFGISETLFSDPLFAGRLVSVLFGVLSAIGLYKIGQKIRNKKAGIIAVFCYLIIPIFTFYDRQALMEAAIGSIGIWIFYYLLLMRKTQAKRYPVLIGLLLGIGFMIKSQALLFFTPLLILGLLSLLKQTEKTSIILKKHSLVLFTFFCTIILLLLQPEYWKTLSLNSKYVLTIPELLHFPFQLWVSTLLANLSIIFFFVTPGVMLLSSVYIISVIRRRSKATKDEMLLVFWFIVLLFLQTLLIKGTSQRYLVSYLPFVSLFSAFTITSIAKPLFQKASYLLFLPAILLSILQILNPVSYIFFMEKLTPYAELGYIRGYTAGVLVNDVVSFLEKEGKKEKIAIGIAKNAGNPESALMAYSQKSSAYAVGYMDGSDLQIDLDTYDCLSVGRPLYFVAREDQKGILGKFLDKKTVFKSPYDSYYLSVYSFKTTNCKNPLQLQITK